LIGRAERREPPDADTIGRLTPLRSLAETDDRDAVTNCDLQLPLTCPSSEWGRPDGTDGRPDSARKDQAFELQLRGQKVMLDRDLAKLYGVTTKTLNQAVKRNLIRLPLEFMFRLTSEEAEPMRSQSVTASKRNMPFDRR
jgi:ORF6N domain